MNNDEFNSSLKDNEQRLERASQLYNKCMGTVLEKFINKDDTYADVTQHCLD
jgi:hypothetical protein